MMKELPTKLNRIETEKMSSNWSLILECLSCYKHIELTLRLTQLVPYAQEPSSSAQ